MASVITFPSQTTLLRWLTFVLESLTVTPTALLFWIYLGSICSTKAFPPLGNSDHVVISVSIDFPRNLEQDTPFHHIAHDYSLVDRDGLRNHLRDVPWEDIFKLSISADVSDICV